MDIPLLGVIPADPQLTQMELSGHPLVELDDDSPVYKAVSVMLQQDTAVGYDFAGAKF